MTSEDAAAAVDAPARPLLTVLRGEPTPEQLAALIAVVSSRGGGGEPDAPPRRSTWARPVLRRPLSPGPGAWRTSALPQ